ncbi:Oxidoreductase OS=Streptomyces antimycoticus OX=68175 GN=SSPO_093620 PE=3 SV=1 [Streptomyces antimycoticus]
MIALNIEAVLHTSLGAAASAVHGVPGSARAADRRTLQLGGLLVARGPGNSVYSATKHAVGAFSGRRCARRSTARGVRAGLVEPGMTVTEMTACDRTATVARGMARESWLRPEDIARAIAFMVVQPAHAAVNEIMVRPTAQEH